ncbi:MAG: HyaD/HybD family hydrogenase maturation endopeptidase [Desulfobacteraceae bacterium]|nr:HyaD/HybD family hydrogenase maturation endopeptidase [Desulfobacteraceae bacterium]
MKKILVLGIGNILLKDEGAGVHLVNHLEKNYQFSSNVTLLDGGSLGMRLIPWICETDVLIIADIFAGSGKPGSIYRYNYDELKGKISAKNSLHQVTFLETLATANLMEILPEKIIIHGIQPADISPWGTKMTPELKKTFPKFIGAVVNEIRAVGGGNPLSSQDQYPLF